MADNYIERKMEEHRNGKMQSGAPRRMTPSGLKPGKAMIDYPVKNVLIACSSGFGTTEEALIRTFRSAGCHVAVVSAAKEATAVCQKWGAQLHNTDPEEQANIESAWSYARASFGQSDEVFVDLRCFPDTAVMASGNSTRLFRSLPTASYKDISTALSRLAILLSAPGSELITRTEILIG